MYSNDHYSVYASNNSPFKYYFYYFVYWAISATAAMYFIEAHTVSFLCLVN
jgi:hypothetical protein